MLEEDKQDTLKSVFIELINVPKNGTLSSAYLEAFGTVVDGLKELGRGLLDVVLITIFVLYWLFLIMFYPATYFLVRFLRRKVKEKYKREIERVHKSYRPVEEKDYEE